MFKSKLILGKEIRRRKFSPLSRGLTLWILSLSILPLTIVSWLNYQQANTTLTQAATEKLKQSSILSVKFIETWFKYRVMDINVQSKTHSNISLLASLSEGFNTSNQSLPDYIKSYDWVKRVGTTHNELISLQHDYDYIYDIFLIDNKGNILYSNTHETDLGTNLFDGPYANTKFASSTKLPY